MLGVRVGDFHFSSRDCHLDARQFLLLLLSHSIEPCGFRFVLAQFAFQRQRARIALASTGNHPAVITGAIKREVIAVRILVRQRFCRVARFNQVCGAKTREEMLRRRAKRVAEIYQTVEPRDHTRSHRQGAIRFGCLNVQLAERIDEKCGASAHFVAQQRNAGARLIK